MTRKNEKRVIVIMTVVVEGRVENEETIETIEMKIHATDLVIDEGAARGTVIPGKGGVETDLTNLRITAAQEATRNGEDLVLEIIMTAKDKDTKTIIKKSCVIIAITGKRRISIRENLEAEVEKDAIDLEFENEIHFTFL